MMNQKVTWQLLCKVYAEGLDSYSVRVGETAVWVSVAVNKPSRLLLALVSDGLGQVPFWKDHV